MNNTRLETLLGLVLLVGVFLSLAIEAVALAAYVADGGYEIVLTEKYRVSAPSFVDYLINLPEMGFTASGLMAFGLVLLMLTPYARVVTSLIYFAATNNLKYMLITVFVLAVLTVSLLPIDVFKIE